MRECISGKMIGFTNRRDLYNIQIQKKSENSKLPEREHDPLEGIGCRIGDNTCAAKHVNAMQRKSLFHPMNEAQKVTSINRLQQQYGNRFVQRVIARNAIQTKLRVGRPGDIYEKEADRVADQVMRMPEPGVQRTVEGEEEEEKEEAGIESELPEEDKEEIPLAQAKQVDGKTLQPSPGVEARIGQLKGGGQPLPKSVRSFFEPRFGYNFSQVRVHTDATSDQITREINATAFTNRNHIVFRAGQFSPFMTAGRRLLAHELVHVIQQGALSQRTSRIKSTAKENNEPHEQRMSNVVPQGKSRNKRHSLALSFLRSPELVQRFLLPYHLRALRFSPFYTARERKEIAFGSWQADYSQLYLLRKFLFPRTCIFEIVKVMAREKFGKRAASRMTMKSFGKYRREHHFDPKPSSKLGPQVVPEYIMDAKKDVKKTLMKAIDNGPTFRGREYYGRALHAIEDFFAHTNFVEIAIKLRGYSHIQTYGGKYAGRYRLVSGAFGALDGVIGILNEIQDELRKPSKSNVITTGDAIVIGLLRCLRWVIGRILPKPRSYPFFLKKWLILARNMPVGHALAFLYEKSIRLYHYINSIPGKILSKIPGVRRVYKWIRHQFQRAKMWVKRKIAKAIRKAMQELAELNEWMTMIEAILTGELKPVLTGKYQPTHTEMHKDDPLRPRYKQARKLADHVTGKIDQEVFLAWSIKKQTSFPIGPFGMPNETKLEKWVRAIQVYKAEHMVGHPLPLLRPNDPGVVKLVNQMYALDIIKKNIRKLVDAFIKHPDSCTWWHRYIEKRTQ